MLDFKRKYISTNFCKQLFLFISSYLPLYLWLILSSFDYTHIKNVVSANQMPNYDPRDVVINLVLFILIAITIIGLIRMLNSTSGNSDKLSENITIKPNSDSMMNYLITYIVPLMNFDRDNLLSIFSNIFLFILIALLYSVNNVTFLNPTLGLLKYKVYEVEGDKDMHHILTRKSYNELMDLQSKSGSKEAKDSFVHFQNIADGVFLIK